MAVLALLLSPAANAATPDLTGNTWEGWTLVGTNSDLGIYAKGSHSSSPSPECYKIYTAVFESPGPFSGNNTNKPANDFAVGNKILAIGFEKIVGNWTYPILKLDFDNNSYTASTTAPVANSILGDGRTSGSTNATIGDATVQFSVGQPSEISIYKTNGPSATFDNHPYGSYGSNGLPGIRGVLNTSGGRYFKTYFDLTTLPTAYPNIVTGGTQAIGAIQNQLSMSIAMIGGTVNAEAFIKVSTQLPPPPAPVLTAQGFQAPLDRPVSVKRANRVLPLRMKLLNSTGGIVSSITPPVLQVDYTGGFTYPPGALEELLSAGQGSEGNAFVWNGEYWAFNLNTKGLAKGSYSLFAVSGDVLEYVIDPTCTATVQIE